MIYALDQDLRFAPNAFDWLGSTEVARVKDWLHSHGREVPDDLIALWALTGGGDMFETEEIFAPTGVGGLGANLSAAGAAYSATDASAIRAG